MKASQFLEWLHACGLDIRVVRLHEPVIDLIDLTVEDIRLFVRFLAVWPELHPAVRKTFRAQMREWTTVEASRADEKPDGANETEVA